MHKALASFVWYFANCKHDIFFKCCLLINVVGNVTGLLQNWILGHLRMELSILVEECKVWVPLPFLPSLCEMKSGGEGLGRGPEDKTKLSSSPWR